jgi:hypothetical protein
MYRRNYEKLCLKTSTVHYWLGLEDGFLLGIKNIVIVSITFGFSHGMRNYRDGFR